MVALLDVVEAAGTIMRSANAAEKHSATVDLSDRGHDAVAIGRSALLKMNASAVSDVAPLETAMVNERQELGTIKGTVNVRMWGARAAGRIANGGHLSIKSNDGRRL